MEKFVSELWWMGVWCACCGYGILIEEMRGFLSEKGCPRSVINYLKKVHNLHNYECVCQLILNTLKTHVNDQGEYNSSDRTQNLPLQMINASFLT